jgi:hypothetical protein
MRITFATRHLTRTPRRRGWLAVELLFVLPIVLLLLAALVEFTLLLHARQRLAAASREGCRIAAVGGDADAVALATRRVLGNGKLGQAEILITGEDPENHADSTAASGEAVAVWVKLPAALVVPDLLRIIGYSIRDEELVGRTVMRRE